MTTTKLKLPELTASQAQKHITHNEALFFLDTLVQLAVIDRDLATPPGAPALGDTYIVAASPTGSWVGKAGEVAAYDGSGWIFFAPVEGWKAWVNDENITIGWNGTSWIDVSGGGGGGGLTAAAFNDGTVTLLGINGAVADTTNRLSINTPAVLFNHAGATVDMTLNKAAAGDDASLSFKTGFTAHAIVGLLADNDLAIKVGASLLTAVKINNTTAEATFNYPLALEGQATLPAAPPAGSIKLYSRDRAGTQWLDVQRASGRDFPLQPHLGVNRLAWWAPSSGGSINTNGIPRSSVGTGSTPGISAANLASSMRRWRMTSAATAASVAEERAATNVCWRGNAARLGGFTYINRLSLTTIQADSTAFFGIYGATGALSTSLVTADMLNCIGIGFTNGVHTNWQIIHNDNAGAPTTIDLGASFPISSTTNVYTLTIVAEPNGSNIVVRVVEEVSETVHESTLSSDIPVSTQFLSIRNYLNNGATAAAVVYDCSGVYLETDY